MSHFEDYNRPIVDAQAFSYRWEHGAQNKRGSLIQIWDPNLVRVNVRGNICLVQNLKNPLNINSNIYTADNNML